MPYRNIAAPISALEDQHEATLLARHGVDTSFSSGENLIISAGRNGGMGVRSARTVAPAAKLRDDSGFPRSLAGEEARGDRRRDRLLPCLGKAGPGSRVGDQADGGYGQASTLDLWRGHGSAAIGRY